MYLLAYEIAEKEQLVAMGVTSMRTNVRYPTRSCRLRLVEFGKKRSEEEGSLCRTSA